jgi:hypothetical protein
VISAPVTAVKAMRAGRSMVRRDPIVVSSTRMANVARDLGPSAERGTVTAGRSDLM